VTLLAPLGLLALLAVPVLIVFYLLKVRYRDHEVGSTYLWAQLTRDLAVHEPWQRPRFSVLLLIQALLLGALALALARPAIVTGQQERVHAVVLLDGTASMSATDVSPSRFEQARGRAHDTLRALPDGSTGTVILAGARPEVLAAETADRARLVAAVDAARPTDAAGDLGGALRMAVALARGRPAGQVHVFSDAAFATPELDTTGVKLFYEPFAGGSDNRAIVALDARPEPQNRRRHQAFVRVQSYADAPTSATVALRADDQLIDSQTLRIEAGGSGSLVFADLPLDARVLEARLLERDALAADDRAWTVLDRRQPTQVLLVTNGNLFLERVLGLIPDVEPFRVPPRRLGAIDDSTYDVIVYDGITPDFLPRRPVLIVNTQDSPALPVRGLVRRPGPLVGVADEPLLRYVDLRDVRVARLTQVAVPGWARVVAEADGHPAILAGEADGRRAVVFLFDLQSSNLPLSASYPILMANVLGYLEPSRALDQPVVRPGGALQVIAQPQTEEVRLESAEAVLQTLKPAGGPLTVDAPAHVGLYQVSQVALGKVASLEPFAVNLVDAEESDLRPRTMQLPSDSAARGSGLPGARELWGLAIAVVAGLLVAEWWWFHRRA
jgi:Ca-activated chloride channel family protein